MLHMHILGNALFATCLQLKCWVAAFPYMARHSYHRSTIIQVAALLAIERITLNQGMQGNCTAGLHTGAESAAARLKRLYRELSGSRVPLKPFQCLILTNSNTLFLSHGNGFWLDNLYVGVMQPRRQYDKALAEVVSTGESATNTSIGLKPMNIFLTNITMHGHGLEEYSTRLVSLERYNSWTSLLFQGKCIPGHAEHH